jgi:hypothetical protein
VIPGDNACRKGYIKRRLSLEVSRAHSLTESWFLFYVPWVTVGTETDVFTINSNIINR